MKCAGLDAKQAGEEAQRFCGSLAHGDKGCLLLGSAPFEQPQEMPMIKSL